MDCPIRVSEEVISAVGITLPEGKTIAPQGIDLHQTFSQLIEDTFGRFRSPSLSPDQIQTGKQYIISQLTKENP